VVQRYFLIQWILYFPFLAAQAPLKILRELTNWPLLHLDGFVGGRRRRPCSCESEEVNGTMVPYCSNHVSPTISIVVLWRIIGRREVKSDCRGFFSAAKRSPNWRHRSSLTPSRQQYIEPYTAQSALLGILVQYFHTVQYMPSLSFSVLTHSTCISHGQSSGQNPSRAENLPISRGDFVRWRC